jgi:hypothetical protein
VEYHDDPKNKFKFKHDTTDDIWLAAVAQEGWIVFSHDRKFHTCCRNALRLSNIMRGASTSSPTWDKMCHFIKAYQGIVDRIGVTPKPFIFELSHTGRFKRVPIP